MTFLILHSAVEVCVGFLMLPKSVPLLKLFLALCYDSPGIQEECSAASQLPWWQTIYSLGEIA